MGHLWGLPVTLDAAVSASHSSVTWSGSDKVLVLAGQSNARGTQALQTRGLHARLFDAATWSSVEVWDSVGGEFAALDLTSIPSTPAGYFGLELPMLAELGVTKLLKYAVGSTSLADDWLAGADHASELASQMTAAGGDPLVVWVHGEADASDATDAAAYGANLTALSTALGDPPMLVVALHPDCIRTHASTVRTAQLAFSDGVVDPAQIAHPTTDGIHYHAKVIEQIGFMAAAQVVLS